MQISFMKISSKFHYSLRICSLSNRLYLDIELYFSHILSIIIFVHHEFRQENTICNMEIYSSTFNTRRHIDESFCNMKIPIYTINCNIDFCIIRLSTSLLLLSSSSTIIINRKQNFYL